MKTSPSKPDLMSEPPEPPEPAPSRAESPLAAARATAVTLLAELMFDEDAELTKSPGSVGALTRNTGGRGGDRVKRLQAVKALGQAINSQTSGDLATAAQQYEAALRAGLDSPLVCLVLGALYSQLGQRSRAIPWLQRATAHEAVGVGALYGLGQAQHEEHHAAEAMASLLEALKRLDQQQVSPGRADALAEAYENISDGLQNAAPESLEPVVTGILEFLSGDNWEERLSQARRQMDGAAGDGQVTPLADLMAVPGASQAVDALRRIETHMSRRMWATAMEEAYLALTHSPTHLPLHIRMAEILTADNKLEAAVEKYLAVAGAYRIRGELARATRILQQVLRLSPLDVSVRSQLIELLVAQRKYAEALEHFVDLADTYYQLADLESAHNTYSDALLLAQDHDLEQAWGVRILHKLGDIDLQRLNWREAQQVYEQIKALAPEDHSARATLIDLLFRLGESRQAVAELDQYLRQLLTAQNTAQAIGLLEELLEAQPDDLNLIARLARLYQDAGRRDDAIAQYDRLGELQLQSGQTAKAADTIRAILSLKPADASAYQKLLEEIQR